MGVSKSILFAAVALAVAGCVDDGVTNNAGKGGDADRYLRGYSGRAETYALSVGVLPSGCGYVSRSPEQDRYDAGTQVMVNATANSGYMFIEWSGAPQGVEVSSPSITFAISGNAALTANFQRIVVPSGHSSLTVNAGIGGKVNQTGTSFPATGSEVTVTATANSGYTFVGWTGAPQDVDVSSPTIRFNINGDVTLTANFQLQNNGTLAQGANLAAKLAWLGRMVTNQKSYTVIVTADETIEPHTFYYERAIDDTITLTSDGAKRTLKIAKHGNMFTVRSEVTLILDNNITLQGHSGNSGAMVYVNGGKFIMNDGVVITGNVNSGNGGGVYVASGVFEMNGGTISGNVAANGGGVYVYNGTFAMSDGVISGNKAKRGGGVYDYSAFTMSGGVIMRNTASEYGGGVYVQSYSAFNKLDVGGIITGYMDDSVDGNVVRDDDSVKYRMGHAVYVSGAEKHRDSSVGAGEKLRINVSGYGNEGIWD